MDPHAHTDRTWGTRVAEPRLPAPEDGRLGEGRRLTPDAPHNGGRPPPPGDGPQHPRSTQPPQGMQAKGTVPCPHTRTPAPTARGWRTPTARPEDGPSGEGKRLASDAPHNGERRPPWGLPSANPAASNASPQGRTLWGRCRTPTPAPAAPRTHGSRNPDCPPQRMGGRGRDSASHQTPLTAVAGQPPRGTQPPQGMRAKGTVLDPHNRTPGQPGEGERLGADAPHNGKGTPPGDALPPPLQCATPARKGARYGAGAGSPRPHGPRPGHTGRRTPAGGG